MFSLKVRLDITEMNGFLCDCSYFINDSGCRTHISTKASASTTTSTDLFVSSLRRTTTQIRSCIFVLDPFNLGKVFIFGILLDNINLFIGLQVQTIVAVFYSSIGIFMQKVTFLLERQLFPSYQVHTTSEIYKYPTSTLHRLP